MAAISFQCLHHHHQSLPNLHLTDSPSTTVPSPFLKPTTTAAASISSLSKSLSSFTPSPLSSSKTTVSFQVLQQHLSSQDFQQADQETRRLLLLLAGEAAHKRGYIFFSEVQFIPKPDLKAIDKLWREHSNNRYGYSVQKKIWEEEEHDFSRLFIKIGWMKKIGTQFHYKSFPDEFVWELKGDTPHGHLPLTNALRGVQLFKSILTHQAFDDPTLPENGGDEEKEGGELGNGRFKGDLGIFATPICDWLQKNR